MQAFWLFCFFDGIIYCEVDSKPDDWSNDWNCYNDSYDYYCPVVWDCKSNDVADNGNIYIFKTKGVMQYTVYLDDYTVEI